MPLTLCSVVRIFATRPFLAMLPQAPGSDARGALWVCGRQRHATGSYTTGSDAPERYTRESKEAEAGGGDRRRSAPVSLLRAKCDGGGGGALILFSGGGAVELKTWLEARGKETRRVRVYDFLFKA